jgi:DNA-binding HxlR family transcriptional regulator
MIIKGKEYVVKLRGNTYHCAMDITMDFIGGKWKAVVLWYLKDQTLRFGQLRKLIPDITEKMLSLQLKSLEQDGIVQRKVYNEVPLRVEYSLTDFGNSLKPVIEAIGKWGRHLAETEGKVTELTRKKTVTPK